MHILHAREFGVKRLNLEQEGTALLYRSQEGAIF